MQDLDVNTVRDEIRRFLQEDVGSGDLTTAYMIPADAEAHGWIVSREDCIVAGMEIAQIVFSELDESVEYTVLMADGSEAKAGTRLARLQGQASPILTGERLALNLLQRLCGVATLTRAFVNAVAGTGVEISDTRKTTPGLRRYEKYAVRTGGGRNHRNGLYDAVLIKDNHIAVVGNTQIALLRAMKLNMTGVPIQIEVDGPEQLDRLLEIGLDAVLLDNMDPAEVTRSVQKIRKHPCGARCWIEASGGITMENVRAYADSGVDTISVGALTHSVPSINVALDLR